MRSRSSRRILRSRHGALFTFAVCISLVTFSGHAAGAEKSLIGPYFGAAFKIQQNSYAFGQAASWSRIDQVLSGQLDSAGVSQIY